MNLHRGFVAFTLSLLIATTLTVTPGYEDDSDDEFAEEEPQPPPKPIDEWETVEPHYDTPEWHMPEGKVQTLEFGGGDMNDADKWSDHMPMELKCDGCRAIAFAIKQKLKKFQKRYRERHILSEVDVVELMDQVCQNKKGELDGYGMKEILGKRRLSGPGLETKDVPGVSHGGGKWGFRLQQMCSEYVNEIGEYTIYKRFLKHKSMENVLCRNTKSELGWICPRKRKRRKKKDPQPQEGGEGEGGEGENQPEQPPQDSAPDSEQATQDPQQEQKQTEQDAENQPKEDTKQQHGEDAQQSKESETKSGQGPDTPKAEDVKKSEKDAAKPPDQDAKKPDEDSKKPKDGETKPKEGTEKPKDGSKEKTTKANENAKKPQEEADKKVKPEESGKSDGDSNKSSKEGSKQANPGDAKEKQGGQSKEDQKTPKEEL